jgi:hypothetical protein
VSEDGILPDDETLRHLQTLLLRAILQDQPLPGSGQSLSVPDLRFVLRQPAILLSSENLAGSVSIEGLPKPLHVLSPEELIEKSREQGEVAYLRFQPAKQNADTVQLTIEARLATADTERAPLGLGGTQVVFQRVGDEWTVATPPASYAT